ncbi:MAG TPA: 5-(carboxyamino)imidazole ribonucleotide mutase [Opitutaceae bacterium]|nr:5-(carboxyamino)imidazole ribonucleotide mutase [Opitutaceae bacterium]
MASTRKPSGRARASRRPVVGLLMGSTSDWETMRHAADTLDALGIPYERRVMSAHRTPRLMISYATGAAARGLRVVIGGAGGAAHLAGLMAALTPIPVLGVPMESASLKGMDSLLSIVQMPGGIPVATFAIGRPGAVNAALFAAAILAHGDPAVRRALSAYRSAQTRKVLRARLP